MDTSKIKKKIIEAIETTSLQIEKYKELTKPIAPENAIGRVSRMDAINNKSINDKALKQAELKFKNLKVALSKIDDEDFGICIKCKKPIPEGRILLIPQAITCVNCAG
ncbi:TraR/DksA family transcriptional regulator [Patiriisocius hiemis]|uniref:TraR/DksA C4-type zinc finger protein n=1 Tax=Patiriisocius hiemis TaxID=3075604 RepID=A0ABU2YC02_9FLAO|nr:TraR/DksA C4-type zinc finger protein [Constantimarinum sp. W242]MDT0554770.1 TraR/DksA C4-type zinc finger protein [Constantimarinum sp. W242]